MITSRTKKQLVVFAIITLLGVSFVGARYARLDRLFLDTSYQVTARFAESGGIFEGAEVTYRGVKVGTVSRMELPGRGAGVDVVLEIDNDRDRIPSDTIAIVGNKSAVGEQYVELEPRTANAPFLKEGSRIATADTAVPVSTTEILTNLNNLVTSVPQDKLRTVVTELGDAFKDTGDDLAQIIDTSNEFIQAANANFDITTALIRDANTVLRTQALKGSAIRSFARDLNLFTDVVASNDTALRKLIENGSATAVELRSFLQENQVNLGGLINNLVTTGEVAIKYLPGLRQVLVLYPYMVAGGYTVTAKADGVFNARFGFIFNPVPAVCGKGYDPNERRSPSDRGPKAMDEDAGCTAPANQTNARGAQNAPRVAPADAGPEVGTYDLDSGEFQWTTTGAGGAAANEEPPSFRSLLVGSVM